MSTDADPQKPLVLVVDDFSDTRTMYAEFLEFSGFRVIEASDGYEALAQVAARKPDIVVMDLSLPGIDGWTATRRIKADPATAHIPIIAVSGHSGSEIEEAREAGCVDCLVKPCMPDDLVDRIRAVLAAGAGAPVGAG